MEILICLILFVLLPSIQYHFLNRPPGYLHCGLFGYSGKNPVDLLRLKWLATENQSRGDDSTGVYGNYLCKTTDTAKRFILTSDFEDAVEGAQNIIGHTRKATIGSKIQANAHPFELKSTSKKESLIVGTHNGQLFPTSFDAVAKKYSLDKPDVDSEFIYRMIVHHNFDYDAALSELEGMMALAWIRPEFKDHLYLYRRDSRPLHVGFIDGVNMYYSSEAEPLHFIGCDAIEALDSDLLYVFKNGGLLEVSPVKKSLIRVTTLDQGVTTFLQTATEQEKAVLGISSVVAQTNHNANSNQSRTARRVGIPAGRTITADATDGGQSGNFQHGPAQLEIFRRVPTGLYVFEDAIRPPKTGKYYDVGNDNNCYIIAQLVSANDDFNTLPAWIVRVRGRHETTFITTHNGVALLEIPSKDCENKVVLELFNPLQQGVVYTVDVNRIQAGRVLEVTLRIPFPCSEEKTEKGGSELQSFCSSKVNSSSNKGFNMPYATFEDFVSSIEVDKQVSEQISKKWGLKGVSFGCANWKRDDGLEGYSAANAAVLSRVPISHWLTCGYSKSPLPSIGGVQESEYNKKTDILNMDLYTTETNVDEIKLHQERIREILSSNEGDTEMSDIKAQLSSLDGYLEYLGNYFASRTNALRDQEVDETNRYSVIDDN